MTRGESLTIFFIIFIIFWVILLFSPLSQNPKFFNIIMGFPGYCLISYGCWALISIGDGIATLKNYPEEYSLLLKDIKRA